VADRGARPAVGNPDGRISQRQIARRIGTAPRRISARPECSRAVEGQNVAIEYRWAEGRYDRLPMLASESAALGLLINPLYQGAAPEALAVQAAARSLGRRLVVLNASNERDIEVVFSTLAPQQIGALLVDADALFVSRRDQIVDLAARHSLPTIYDLRDYVEAGGLMSYGPSLSDAYRLVGDYVSRILKGEKPADLPVQRSTKVELTINLRTAKALGLTIPETLLATADEVIQ
jgi:putative tryptophan/tyrosine transport system substrate-binding protein